MCIAGITAALALVLLGQGPACATEPYHLRLGWVVTPADLVTLMFVKPGLAPHAGKTYIPELTHFAGTPTRSSHAVATFSTGGNAADETTPGRETASHVMASRNSRM